MLSNGFDVSLPQRFQASSDQVERLLRVRLTSGTSSAATVRGFFIHEKGGNERRPTSRRRMAVRWAEG
jgi:hypothetical protein